MQGVTGGELLFRRRRHDRQFSLIAPATKNEYITTFLDIDEDRACLKKHYADKLLALRNMRDRQRNSYAQQEKFEKKLAPEMLKLKCKRIMSSVKLFNDQFTVKTEDLVNEIDVKLMQQVLKYFAIMKNEIKVTRKRNESVTRSFQIELNQVKMKRHLKLFASHIDEESRNAITLSYLSKESAQFKRCEKAVLDNASIELKDQMKVLNIMKLEHSFLSDDLHNAASDPNGKVKGLFTVVSKKNIYPMCAFGLHAQVLPGDAHKSLLAREVFPRSRFSSDLFRPSWFSLDPPKNREMDFIGPKNYGIARNLAESRRILNMRFSKRSTPSVLTSSPHGPVEETFLALCRVFMSNLLTIAEPFTEKIIHDARRKGYDAVFSSHMGEYILLMPSQVLPEFIIQLQFDIGDSCLVPEISSQAAPTKNIFLYSLQSSVMSHSRTLPQYLSSLEYDGNDGSGAIDESRNSSVEKRKIVACIGNLSSDFFRRRRAQFLSSSEAGVKVDLQILNI